MKLTYDEVVKYLESLTIMPKTMPGLLKMQKALARTDWFSKIDPSKVIVIAGTNGKGSTCVMLEALLLHAKQKVGFYSSPHLISTTERIRHMGLSISEEMFVDVFTECEELIRKCELSHFEALSLMAGTFYFSRKWNLNLDCVILEVGLGGSFDATNAFPHKYSVITKIGFDHMNILGNTLQEIAKNKFGIIQNSNVVIYQRLQSDLQKILNEKLNQTKSLGYPVEKADLVVQKDKNSLSYTMNTKWGQTNLSMLGQRAAENAMSALTCFAAMGHSPEKNLKALSHVSWAGRMQKVNWKNLSCPLYLSGDHNPQGVASLIDIIKDFSYRRLHLVVGIGQDKDADEMLAELVKLKNINLYLTVTPFKGRSLSQYDKKYQDLALLKHEDPASILNQLAEIASGDDLVIVTGSLYLVGLVLRSGNCLR